MIVALARFMVVISLFSPANAEPDVEGREIKISVKVNGKLYLSGTAWDNGKEAPADVWRKLNDVALQQAKDVQIEITDDMDTETGERRARALLHGKIIVKVEHAGEVEVSELTLMLIGDAQQAEPMEDQFLLGATMISLLSFSPGQAVFLTSRALMVRQSPKLWHLDAVQVDQMGETIGFKRPASPDPFGDFKGPAQAESDFPWFWAGLTVLAGLVVAIGLMLVLGRRKKPA
jgi:hypothetical protein